MFKNHHYTDSLLYCICKLLFQSVLILYIFSTSLSFLCPSFGCHLFFSGLACHQEHECLIRGPQWGLQGHHMEETPLSGLDLPIRTWRPVANGPLLHSSRCSSRLCRVETESEYNMTYTNDQEPTKELQDDIITGT